MDSPVESPPAKKRCKREFQLPRQFPSTVKQGFKRDINIVESAPSTIMLPNTVKVLSSPEKRVPYNLQKLRILSPRGRDLGEFNVELRSTNPLKGSTITITKSTVKSADKSVTLPLSPVSHVRVLPRILKQGTTKMSNDNLSEVISCNKHSTTSCIFDTENTNVSHQQQSTTVPISRTLSNGQNTKGKMEKKTCNNSINVDKAPSTSGINSKRSMSQINNSSIQYTVHNNKTKDTDIRNCTKIQEITAEKNEASSAKEIIELSCPVNSKKLTINSSNSNNVPLYKKNIKVSKGKCIATIKNTENGKIVMSLKSAANLMQRNKQIDRNLNQIDLHNNSRKKFDNSEVLYDRNSLYDRNNSSQIMSDVIRKGQVLEIKKTQNVMTIIPNKAVSFNQNAVSTQECNTSVTSGSVKNISTVDHGIVKHDTKCDSTQSKCSMEESRDDLLAVADIHARRMVYPELQRITNVTDANMQSKIQNKNCSKDLPEKDLSDRLDIIKKAMDSVKDNELRELALKALADCGIGIERYVPIRPPEDHKAVHDTQVQTVVFGLLDPKSFILINKDLEDIQRINQITLHDTPDDQNLSSDNSHCNNIVSEDPNIIESESPFDLDSFMEQFWKGDSDALKMKEALSMSRVRCNSLLDNLQKDFECVKQYDQNGMLNIHNAVISDNIYLVRRQLIVLERCKQNIDTLTENGATSLELAIKYDVCSEIVKLLLDAGAQPVIPRSIHESAVIIASKRSSPLLSMLVSRISDSKLLDQIDSDGFAALHYCSIRGDLQGVNTLLSAGATIDLKDMKSGRTALFHAIDNNHMSVMQVLLKAGAANIANYAGQMPLSVMTDPKSLVLKPSLKRDVT